MAWADGLVSRPAFRRRVGIHLLHCGGEPAAVPCSANVLGRTNASMQFLSQGIAPLGALLAGILGGMIGLRLTILIGVLGVMLAGTWLLLSPVRKV